MIALIRGRISWAQLIITITGSLCAMAPRVQGQKEQVPNIDSVTSEQFRAYLRRLHFVTDTEAGDRQALLVGHYPDSAQFGPVATILPEARANLISGTLLARGRVIARITHETADSYPRLGLMPHAVTYWWVEYNRRTDTGRSVFIAVDADTNIVGRTPRGLQVTREHREYRGSEPTARFVWTESGELGWGNCGWGCCRSLPLP